MSNESSPLRSAILILNLSGRVVKDESSSRYSLQEVRISNSTEHRELLFDGFDAPLHAESEYKLLELFEKWAVQQFGPVSTRLLMDDTAIVIPEALPYSQRGASLLMIIGLIGFVAGLGLSLIERNYLSPLLICGGLMALSLILTIVSERSRTD